MLGMASEGVVQYEGLYKTSGEYVAALQTWLQQMYHYQVINNSFPYFLAASIQGGSALPTGASAGGPPPPPASTQVRPQTGQPPLPQRGQEFIVPSMWKRLLSETIDFLLLFIIKLAVTYVAVDFFDMFEVDQYNLETLKADVLSDYHLTMTMTWDILLLETIHRIGNCIFEALCLHRGGGARVGGATPGKKVMGLRVVRCQWVVPSLHGQVLVYPATDLGLGRALVRSVTKNVAITLMLPLFLTMFLYQHNRTLYDVLAGSIVVEDRVPPRNNNRPANNNNDVNVNNNNINNAR